MEGAERNCFPGTWSILYTYKILRHGSTPADATSTIVDAKASQQLQRMKYQGCSQSELSRPALRSGVHPGPAARCNEEDATGVAFAVSWQYFSQHSSVSEYSCLLVILLYSLVDSMASNAKATTAMALTSGLSPFASRTSQPSQHFLHTASPTNQLCLPSPRCSWLKKAAAGFGRDFINLRQSRVVLT